MAGADYYRCDICGSKCFYDAAIDWGAQHTGQIAAVCRKCYGFGARVSIVAPNGDRIPGTVMPDDFEG